MPFRPRTTHRRMYKFTEISLLFLIVFFCHGSYQLAAVNPGIDATCSNLLPEESLCLGTEDQDCKEIYVVQPDDTCDIVAASQGINSTMVRFNNPQIDEECSNLYIGEVRTFLLIQ